MSAYELAKEQYAAHGVDAEMALNTLANVSVSVHCWQGDDVGGFEGGSSLGGGLAVTGNYPGKARTPDELRSDLAKAYSLVPGRHRLNLHAMYGEFGGSRVDRDAVEPRHFQGWIDWCGSLGLGFDFNPTCFSHVKAGDGFTLSHQDAGVREFWIEHCRRCREIGDHAGGVLGSKCVTNVWVPDGMKDTPADRRAFRERLATSLDRVFEKKLSHNLDSVEPKLFGIGSESYVVGSHEFYLGYAVSRGTMMCLDAGHYHPTESISDKVSSVMCFLDEVLLHVSRGVRWDSDHVIVLNDDLLAIAREIVPDLDRVHIGLDYFDASISRVAAWVVGTRAMLRALLIALLEPRDLLLEHEARFDYTTRLVLQETAKSLPWGAVWSEHCRRHSVPIEGEWLKDVKQYESEVIGSRG